MLQDGDKVCTLISQVNANCITERHDRYQDVSPGEERSALETCPQQRTHSEMDSASEESSLISSDNDIQTYGIHHRGRQDSRTLDRYLSESEQRLKETYVGERLPYSDYSSIDFLHDLVSIDCNQA